MRSGQKSESRSADAGKPRADADAACDRPPHADPHLRSCTEISGYDVIATDGHIGHVQGLLLDEKSWAIRFMVVNTSNWWLGHQVLIAPPWITDIQWQDRTVSVSLTREAVKGSPPYSPGARMSRDEEARIYDHYDKPGCWAREVQMENPEFRVIDRAPLDG